MKRLCCLFGLVLIASLISIPSYAAQKEWTWMVFLNADNNLDSCGVDDQNEMAKVGSNDFLNIISLIDRENGPATLNYIEKGKIKKLKDMGELDMGDYKVMVKFVKDMVAAYPAKHYALIVWNHGSGWDKAKAATLKGISYDDSTGNHITTAQLGTAMKEIKGIIGHNLDIFAMDACLMQMIEVAYEVRASCDFVLASEETEPGDGYPYDEMLAGLKKGMTPADFCKHLVKAYCASYNGGSQGSEASTQSAIDCSKLDALRAALDGFAKVAIAGKFAPQFKTALDKVQEFYYSENKDFLHLVQLLKGSIEDQDFQKVAKALEAALKVAIIANGNVESSMANAFGLAVYFPTSSYSFSSNYSQLAWAKDSMYDEMVQDYYKKSNSNIVDDVENGDTSSLYGFVSTANANNREVSADLISKLNFRLHSEGNLNRSLLDTVSGLVQELKSR